MAKGAKARGGAVDAVLAPVEEALSSARGAELREMVAALQDAVRRAEFAAASEGAGGGEPETCPCCGCCDHVVKKGHDRAGRQRWLCKDCGRTFGEGTNRVLARSRLPEEKWMAHVECLVLRLTLRESAARCGVCLKTAWFMRHRLLEVLARFVPAFSVGAGMGAELDETYFRENFKGRHGPAFEMPRKARRRGGSPGKRGLSKEQICVAGGVNNSGGAFLEVVGRGPASASELASALRGRVEAGSIVSTDKASAYRSVLAAAGVSEHRAYSSKDRAEGTINRVNALHSALDGFMAGFRGVATKHLHAYLAWFLWDRAFRAGGGPAAETAVRQLAAGVYHTPWRGYVGSPALFMGYWEEVKRKAEEESRAKAEAEEEAGAGAEPEAA